MAFIKSEYLGELRTQAEHSLSGNKILTDAPPDNNGKGEAFSPTDLVCAALGSCMMTIMGIQAQKWGLNLEGMTYETEKFMEANPRRISRIKIHYNWENPEGTAEQREALKEAARRCPVALSLHSDIQQEVTFGF